MNGGRGAKPWAFRPEPAIMPPMNKHHRIAGRGKIALGAALIAVFAGWTSRAQNAAVLRVQSRLIFGRLPARMPGAQADTPARVALGEKLYFDKRLSVNDSQSCDTCHLLGDRHAGVDNEPTSPGALGKRGDRNSPTTLNAGFHLAQFWDGHAPTLEAQAKDPLLDPGEMAMPDAEAVVKKLAALPEYPPLFARAFPKKPEITFDHLAEAIAAFERTLITHDRFDDFLNGDSAALSPKELRGLETFLSVGCLTCHMGPLLGGNMYQKIGVAHPYENTADKGRYAVTHDENDLYKFKVPSLRNVALTRPYFHDGSRETLARAVRDMAWLELDRKLTDAETDLIVMFLQTLSDKARAPRDTE